MGKSTPSAPAAPDPVATANAQAAANKDTAIAQAQLNMVDQYTPYGSLVYSQIPNTGPQFNQAAYDSATSSYQKALDAYNASQSSSFGGGGRFGGNRNNGYRAPAAPDINDFYTKSSDVPRYSATTTLSPEEQKILGQSEGAKLNLATLANNQSAFLNDYLSKPVDLNNNATEARLMELGRSRLDPILAERQQNTEQSLADRGIKMGSAAYDRSMSLDTQGKNDAYNQLLLSGRAQSVQEALAQRNQPINEITALLSGSQVSQPNFVNTPTTGVANTDVAGITNAAYQNKLAAYQTQLQQNNSMMGGLFSLGGSLGAAAIANPASFAFLSDIRLKKNIRRVGTTDNGLGLYLFNYTHENDNETQHLGVMAQEVEQVSPDAVIHRPDGYMMVDYAKALGGAA